MKAVIRALRDLFPKTILCICEDHFDVYSVTSSPKGYALIINIESFRQSSGTERKRRGSRRDYVMLKEMWEEFGYRVVEHYDLVQKDFEKAVMEFASMPELACVDSAVVFVMSHGQADPADPRGVLITTSDDKFVSSEWIKDRFSARNCRALINKPKMIFFQACRGSLEDHGVPYEKLNSDFTLLENKLVPVISDLLIVYPTLPGYVSQRDIMLGAMFVQECIAVFKEDSPHSDLLTMLNKVDNRIRHTCQNSSALFQVVYYESWGFNKKMFFKPKEKGSRTI